MKKSLLLALVVLAVGFKSPGTGELSPAERKYAIDYFKQTKARLLSDVKGLSPAQLNFKANDSSWSVAQCVEHIALAETLIWQWMQSTLRQPAAPEKKSEEKYTTDQLIAAVTDRSHKFKAPEMLKPEGKFPSTDAALQAFVSRRDSTIAYLASTQDDLKDHFTVHPAFGTIDLYQGLILLAGHSARHTAQLEEVMANPNFPKH
jgi:DinB superfamily